ncbi:MAG: lysylphosphatidylglycerol synthase transmembrane domain-containing protein [Thermodesulfobacteriota bacterium]
MKSFLGVILKIGVSVFILYFLFRSMDLRAFWTTMVSVQPLAVVFVAALFAASQTISSYRWSVILKKDIEVPYRKVLSIYFIGMFFNNFLPTMVGGDVVKAYYLYKHTRKGHIALASIFLDRYAGFFALMSITVIALAFGGYSLIKGTGLPGLFVLLLGGFYGASLVIWVGPLHSWAMKIMAKIHFYGINHKIDTFYKVLMGYKKHYDILLTIFICSLLVQGGTIISFYVLGRGLGIDVPVGYYFLFIPLTTTVSMLPISLAGLGLREGAFVYLFTRVGVAQEQALTLSLMWFVTSVLVSMIGGVEYVRMGGKKEVVGEGTPPDLKMD